jgi:hypothetical protein
VAPGVPARGLAGRFFAVFFEAEPRFLEAVFFPVHAFDFPAPASEAPTHFRPPFAFA